MRFLRVLVTAGLFSTLLTAQTLTPEQVQKLLDHVDQLEKRVAQLEAERAAANPAGKPAPAAATAPQPSMPGMPGMTAGVPADEITPQTKPNLQIAGFTDINFAASTDPKSHSGFSEGQFVLHLSSKLSKKVTYFGEVSMTARADAGQGSPAAPGFNVEVERSIIRYDVNDKFKISFGRYHTPINYWNTAFHHGSWLQTTASRPEMVQFGGSFIPVHFIGALVEGTTPAGGLNLTYNLGLGNGRSNAINRGGDFGDINNNRAWLATAFIRPDALYGLQLGGSFYHDRVNPAGLPAVDEKITAAHVVWDRENPEIIAEFTNVTHNPVSHAPSSNSQAWYAQFAYRLSSIDPKLKPYYRYEFIHIPASDTMFRTVPSLSESVVGVRYDISLFSAFKLEYRHIRRPNAPIVNGIVGQTSFTF